MAAIDLPSTLPQHPLSDGYSEVAQDGAIRSAPDSGAAKIRRRFTAIATYYGVRYQLTTTEKGYLDTFYRTTTRGGTLRFDWPHPDGTTVEARFRSPPKFAALEVDVIASVELEVLP